MLLGLSSDPVAKAMSRGIPVMSGGAGRAVMSEYVDSASSSRCLENQSNSRFLKPQPSYFIDEEEYDLCQEGAGTWLREAPSLEEVEEVTLDLKTHYVQNQYDDSFREQTDSRVFPGGQELDLDADMGSKEPAEDLQLSRNWTGASADRAFAYPQTARGTSVVDQCVDLLQRDPDVQAAVVSLARDPAIWDAFVKNDKVQELMRNKQMRLPQLEAPPSMEPASPDCTARINPVLMAVLCVKNAVWDMMDTLIDMVNSVFGVVDRKVFGDRNSDPVDKPFKACMVLTILVLALVVLKRNSAPTTMTGQLL